MKINYQFGSNPISSMSASQPSSRAVYFSNEVEAHRRRKGPGPQGRADAPTYRRRTGTSGTGGAGSSGGSGGGFSGGGYQPPVNRPSGGGFRLPLWLIIVLIVVFLLCGGGTLLNQFSDGGGFLPDDSYYAEQPTEITVAQSTPVSGFTPPASSGEGSWTVMLYQDADDQVLEKDIFLDFNEAERVGSTDQVNIVAQLDRFNGGYSGDGNWTSARRYYLTQDDNLDVINSQLAADLGEVNMADPATLVDFVTWAVETFPADHYMLVMSDHGMGWPGGWTDPAPGSKVSHTAPLQKMVGNAMYTDLLDDALAEITRQTGIEKIDIIGMDACLMGQLEVLSAMQPYARYAITSEETEPALGWAYTAFLQALTENPGMSAADLSKLVVQSYIDYDQRIVDEQARIAYLNDLRSGYRSSQQLAQIIGKSVTISAVDLSKLPALMDSVNDLAYSMQDIDQSAVAAARSYALPFTNIFSKTGPSSYIDLGSFVQILKQKSSNGQVRQLADQVMAGIGDAVIAEKHGSNKNGATGVAIYFPNSALYQSPYSGSQSYTLVAERFSKGSLWDDFLAFHYRGRTFEPADNTAVVPSSDLPSRVPGLGQFTVSELRLSSTTAAPGAPVTMRADISGSNIGHIFLFVGYYDKASNAIWVADTDFLEAPDTQEVGGVYYPNWDNDGQFTVKFDWDPILFTISDGSASSVALFTPQQYGASAADAVYSVEGVYRFVSGGSLNAVLNFRDGELVNVFGTSGEGEGGAPHEITPQSGDTFTVTEKWMLLDSQGKVEQTVLQEGSTTLTFGDEPFTWGETYAPEGNYVIGYIVTDLDGNSKEVFSQVTVQ